MGELRCIDLGRTSYDDAMSVQRREVEETLRNRPSTALGVFDKRGGTMILVEHDPPVVTIGRAGKEKNVIATDGELESMGIQVRRVERGGDVTYHGPGQIVGYPILRLEERGKDVHAYLRDLEEMIIRVLGRLGLRGEREKGMTGVWVGGGKVAAIGVAVRRWVTWHGFSLNVCPEMGHYRAIVPCGLDRPVTSLRELLGRPIDVQTVKPLVVECMVEVFGFEKAVEVKA